MNCRSCGKEVCKENKVGYCRSCYQKTEEGRRKNSLSVKKSYNSGKRKPRTFVYRDLPQETKDRMAWNKEGNKLLNADDVFSNKFYYPKSTIRKYIVEERGETCEWCGISEWRGEKISLELDHIDGNNKNNSRENLRLLCPNCHSQTDTWRGRGINKGIKVIEDEKLVEIIQKSTSISMVLKKVELTPAGGNYSRIYKIMEQYQVSLMAR